MGKTLKEHWANPSAGYLDGKLSNKVLVRARYDVAEAINGRPHEVYFTSCATESNNAVLKSLSQQFFPVKKKIISTPIEHSSVMATLEFLKTQGIEVVYCPVDKYGFVKEEVLESLIDDDTFLVCCMFANNELGTVQNLRSLVEIAKSRNILFFADCVQALGKVPIDVRALGIDYASFSAHKIYGPKGIGALYARITAPMIQFIHGGHQEEGLRAGTESLHNIAGFGEACRQLPKLLEMSSHLFGLKTYFESELRRIYPEVIINSPVENGLANTVSVRFPGIRNNEIMLVLDSYGIAVSAGSACNAQENKPSHVLKAVGLTEKEAQETIRISFGKSTTRRNLDFVLSVLAEHLNARD